MDNSALLLLLLLLLFWCRNATFRTCSQESVAGAYPKPHESSPQLARLTSLFPTRTSNYTSIYGSVCCYRSVMTYLHKMHQINAQWRGRIFVYFRPHISFANAVTAMTVFLQ